MCWAHGLYDAIFSIHSRGMNDFISPFIELLNMLQSALKSQDLLSGGFNWMFSLNLGDVVMFVEN